MNDNITNILKVLKLELKSLPFDKKVDELNRIKKELTKISGFGEPIDTVLWVSAEKIQANSYNPNRVATPEMELLYESIKSDGYTQPIVAYKLGPNQYEIVDGFHRSRVGKEFKDINNRVHNYLPITIIDKPLDERMGSTIRHNRARGTHQIKSMSDIVIDLVREGWEDEKICQKLGMDKDEVLRLKQISGLKEAFSDHEFSKSWEDFELKYYPEEAAKPHKTISKAPIRSKQLNL